MKLLKVALTGAVLVAAVNALEEQNAQDAAGVQEVASNEDAPKNKPEKSPEKKAKKKAAKKEAKKEAKKLQKKKEKKQAKLDNWEFDPEADLKKKEEKKEKKKAEKPEKERPALCQVLTPKDPVNYPEGHDFNSYAEWVSPNRKPYQPQELKAKCVNGANNVIKLICKDGKWVLFDFHKKHKEFSEDSIVKKNSKNGRCDLSKEEKESLKAPKKNKSKVDAVFNADGFEADLEVPEIEYDCRDLSNEKRCYYAGGKCQDDGICLKPCPKFSTYNGKVCRCEKGLVANYDFFTNYCKPFDRDCECVSPRCPENSWFDFEKRACVCHEGFWNFGDNAAYCKYNQRDCKCEERIVIDDPELPKCPEGSKFDQKSGYCKCLNGLYSIHTLADGTFKIGKACKPEEENCVCKELPKCKANSFLDRLTLKCVCKPGFEFDKKGNCVRIEEEEEEEEEEPCRCPLYWRPVCGSDGKTYSNECFARCEKVEIAYEEECKDVEIRCEDKCPKDKEPVCAKNDNSYVQFLNSCFAHCAGHKYWVNEPCKEFADEVVEDVTCVDGVCIEEPEEKPEEEKPKEEEEPKEDKPEERPEENVVDKPIEMAPRRGGYYK